MTSAEVKQKPRVYPDGTFKLLGTLGVDPEADIRCSLGEDSPAVAVFATPAGCVARPNDRLQAVCPQHISTDGFIENPTLVLDLTVGEAWSHENGLTPLLHLGFTADEAITCVEALATRGIPIQ